MKYILFNTSDLSIIDFNQVAQTSVETLRYSVDGTKTIIKFKGATPSFLIGEPQYDREEILNILRGEEWFNPIAEIQ
jgi:hypothetical protein